MAKEMKRNLILHTWECERVKQGHHSANKSVSKTLIWWPLLIKKHVYVEDGTRADRYVSFLLSDIFALGRNDELQKT